MVHSYTAGGCVPGELELALDTGSTELLRSSEA